MLLKDGFGTSVPPTNIQVRIYFCNKGINEHSADEFYETYQSKNWRGKRGGILINWKQLAWNYIIDNIEKPR